MKFLGLIATLIFLSRAFAGDPDILIVVGPSNHAPGTHEVGAGGRLLKHCLEHMENVAGVSAEVVFEWPKDDTLLDSVDTLVFIGDTFPPQRMPETENVLNRIQSMANRGCGIVCIHFATALLRQDVAEDGSHPLLGWLGGYFANKTCTHHTGIARVYKNATIEPTGTQHPILNGWKTFTLHDEPYINNYFGTDDNQPAANVTLLATSMLPPESPKREPVAWCVDRTDGGRGFAIVMPHFYKNWADDDLRRFIMNGIVWSAQRDVPQEGVVTATPDLAAFDPAAVEAAPK